MEDEILELKTECGLIYYKEDDKWKMAGREGHPLTKRYIQLLKGIDVCICNDCKMED